MSFFSGSIGRMYFFFGYCIVSVVSLILAFLIRAYTNLIILTFILTLVMVFFALSLIIRRLHDINISSWFALLMLIPGVNFIFVLVLLVWPGN
jgi:uncharacterized membrane protein YhaH (DUF805 family)